jgi:hypothetical protein
MRIILTLASGLLLGGCAFWPVAPAFDLKTQSNGPKVLYQLDPYEARALLANWESALDSAAQNRRTAELVTNELVFYGTLVFTAALAHISHAGGTAHVSRDVLHARNVGAAAAVGSQLLSSHYQWSDQRIAFQAAASRVKCAREALAPLNPAVRALMTDPDITKVNAELTKAGRKETFEALWAAVPGTTTHFVERQVNPDLQAALQAVTLSTPTKAELAAVVDKWKQDTDIGGKAAGQTDKSTLTSRAQQLQSTLRTQAGAAPQGLVEDGKPAEPPRPPPRAARQREQDLALLAGKSEAELADLQKAFVVALVSYGSALPLCK